MIEHNLTARLPHTMFINGESNRSVAGKTFPIFNPATSEEIAQIPDASEADIDHAVRTSKAAFESDAWRRMPPAARERLLLKLADLVEQHSDELATLETLNQGKLIGFSRMLEVAGGVQWLRYMAGWATKIEGTTFDLSIASRRARAITLRPNACRQASSPRSSRGISRC